MMNMFQRRVVRVWKLIKCEVFEVHGANDRVLGVWHTWDGGRQSIKFSDG
jgi:hypothetical protein